ncbi:MAG: hypothetical protein HXO72_00675 [Scardovia wiggsiae]|uniref:DUF6049 family protein n=1 Tax=Scardovia wiggsiae TaxID=230143 RepID=UPI001CAF53A1|nr:hypothetical protein [Scardovia wiggsiae]
MSDTGAKNTSRSSAHLCFRSCCAVLAVLVFAVLALISPAAPSASADSRQLTAAGTQKNTSGVTLALKKSTSVISATSGYSATVTITNNTFRTLDTGKLTAYTRPDFVFRDSDTVQRWAQADFRLDAMSVLGSGDTPAIQPGKSADVTISVKPDARAISRITTWGAKPVLIRYTHKEAASAGSERTGSYTGRSSTSTGRTGNTSNSGGPGPGQEELRTFVTRTNSDLPESSLPKLNVVFALPVTSPKLSRTTVSASDLIHGAGAVRTDSAANSIYSENPDCARQTEYIKSLNNTYPFIQNIIDPAIAGQYKDYPAAAVMQPYGTNVSAISQYPSLQWDSAGIHDHLWDTAAIQKLLKTQGTGSSQGQEDSSGYLFAQAPSIAWQGPHSSWTADALARARQQGYTAVIATSGFSDTGSAAAHTGKLTVPTQSGDITVLSAHSKLSALAQNRATASSSAAEQSQAGRLNRFMAETAFYETQAPYESRTFLITLGSLADTQQRQYTGSLLKLVSQSPWLQTDTLNSLLTADSPYTSRQAADLAQAGSAGKAAAGQHFYASALKTLAGLREKLAVFDRTILVRSSAGGRTSSAGAQGLSRGDAQNNRLAANRGYTLENSATWMGALYTAFDICSLRSFTIDDGSTGTANTGQTVQDTAAQKNADAAAKAAEPAKSIVDTLYSSVSLMHPGSVSAVSDKANLPLTITNSLPFSVKVGIKGTVIKETAQNTSIEISSVKDITVHAHSNKQTTLTITAQGGRRASAKLSLTDSQGKEFGKAVTTQITSALAVNDITGYAIIAVAVTLGALGLYRQIRRIRTGAVNKGDEVAEKH